MANLGALSNAELEAEVLTREDVASLLKCHRKTVANYERTRGLPVYYPSPQKARYLRSEVMAWLRRQREN